jgi:2-(3-amino-3-carboxypropyl)histidine synthase
MESDRAQADLGQGIEAELAADKHGNPKQPKRRFIGRKAAAERAEQNGSFDATIEDSGTIQGR